MKQGVVNKKALFEFIDTYNGPVTELARQAGLGRTTIYAVRAGWREPGVKFINGMIRAGMDKNKLLSA